MKYIGKINSQHFKDYKYLNKLSNSNLQMALCKQTKKYMIIKENCKNDLQIICIPQKPQYFINNYFRYKYIFQ